MAVFTAIATAIGIGGTFLGTLFVAGLKTLVGIGLNKLAMKLAGKKQGDGSQFSVKSQLQRGADLPQSFLIGKCATAGSLTYANTWGEAGGTPNAYLTMVISLSDIPVQSLDGIWVNGEAGTIGATAHADYGFPVKEFHKDGKDHLWVKFFDGTQTAADSYLVNTASNAERPWDANAIGHGTAYAVMTARINQDLFNGFPSFLFELTGARFYDPSKDSSVGGVGAQRWSDPATWGGDGDLLPAVQLYNLFRGMQFGDRWFYGMQATTAEQMPVAHWIGQINKCRSLIAAQGGNEPKFRSGGEIAVGAPIADAMEALLDACQGRITESGGVYKLFVGHPETTVASFSDDDILSTEEQSFTPFFGLADTVNGVNAKYPDPDQGWQIETAPPLNNSDYEAEDGARRLMVDVQFDLVPYAEQVQRLMLASLNEARRARRHTFTLPPRFWALEPGDVVEWTSARNGYDAKLFRVDGVLDQPNADVVVDLTEIDPTDYDFDTNVDFTPVGGGSVTSPIYPPQTIAGWTAQASSVPDSTGLGRLPAIMITWNGDVDDVAAVQVRVRVKATGAVVFSGRFDDVVAGTALIAEGILPATEYEVQGRYIPRSPRDVAWSDWLTVMTLDLRLGITDLATEVGQAISDAQAAADGAAADATQALQDAADVQADHNALTNDFTGTLNAAFSQRDAGIAAAQAAADDVQADHDALVAGFTGGTIEGAIEALRAENEANIAPLGASVLREPRSLWSCNVHVARPDLVKPAVTTGLFITDDADFGECFEFGGVYNTNLGPAYPVEFDPNRVYRITACYKVVDDNGGAGVRLHLGVSTQTGTTLVQSNIQSELHSPWLLVADGPQTSVRYVSGDAAALDAYGIAGSDRIVLTGSASANKLYPQLRQNSRGSTSGKVRVASIEVVDVTEALSGVNALRTELQSNIDGVSATLANDYYTAVATDQAISAAQQTLQSNIDGVASDLQTNHYTIAQTDGAISAATTALQAQMESPSGSIGSLSATLTSDYSTTVQMDHAISAAQTALQSSIDGVSADLSNNYYTSVQVDGAISTAQTTLQADIDDVFSDLADALPSDFSEQGRFWTESISGATAATGDVDANVSFVTTANDGPICRIDISTTVGASNHIAPRGRLPYVVGRKYKVTVTARLTGVSSLGDGRAFNIQFRGLNGRYGSVSGAWSTFHPSFASVDTWEVFTHEFEATDQGAWADIAHLLPFVYRLSSYVRAGAYLDIKSIVIEDVTEAGSIASNLQQNYSTTAQMDQAIALARTTLQSSIDGVASDLSNNYYTEAQTGAAITSATTALQSSIDGVSADLSNNYYTSVQVDGAISTAQTTLQADIDDVFSDLADALPSDFSEQGRFWTESISGATAATGDVDANVSFVTTANDGPICRIDISTTVGASNHIAPRGRLPYVVGRKYKVTVTARLTGVSSLGDGRAFNIQFRGLNGRYGSVSGAWSTFHPSFASVDTWEVFTHEFEATDQGAWADIAHLLPFVYRLSSYVRAGAYLDIKSIVIEDVTEAGSIASNLQQNYSTTAQMDQAIALARTTLQSSIDGVASDLSNNYYTEAQTGAAITSATTALQAAMEAPSGSIGSLSATLTSDYYTGVQTDGAISAAVTTLEATFGPSALSNGCIQDPTLSEQDGTKWTRWSSGGTLTFSDNQVYPTGKSARFVCASGDNSGLYTASHRATWIGAENLDAYVVEVDFTLNSGSLSGAGVRVDWDKTTGERTTPIALQHMQVTGTTGFVQRASAVFLKPSNFAGTFVDHDLYLFANFWGLPNSPKAAKDITFHRCFIRPATPEETGSGILADTLNAEITDIKGLDVDASTAFGTLMQQLQVNAGGTSATITNHASAVAELNGFSSAFAGVTVDTNGGNIAGLRATSFANPDGSGNGVLELLGDVVAEGTLSTNKLVVGLGRNLLSNTDFSDGLQGWIRTGGSGSGATATLSLRPPGSWAGAYFPVLQLYQGSSASDGYRDVEHRPHLTDGSVSVGVPVEAGQWLEASVKASIHRCVFELRIRFLDASGAHLAWSGVIASGNGATSSSTDPELWPVYWGKALAPAGAAYATVHYRKLATNTGSNSYLFIHKPQLAVSHASATQPAPYSPGGTTLISGDKIMTGAITAESAILASASVVEANIQDLAVSTLKIKDQAVTIPVYVQDNVLQNIHSTTDWVTVISAVMDREGYATALQFTAQIDGYGDGNLMFGFARNGGHFNNGFTQHIAGNGSQTNVTISTVDTNTGTGPTTYSVHCRRVSGLNRHGRVFKKFLSAHQFKK